MQNLELKKARVLGASSPYRQGGSIRLSLPKGVINYYLSKGLKIREMEELTILFVETDEGILLRTLEHL